ncbi:MAG: hypothetical protein ACKOEZ_10945 [Spartobacteria bacterium]
MQNCLNYETHDDWEDIILPTGVAQLKRTIDLDFQRIIPMPEPIKRTEKEEFCKFSPRGIALRKENLWEFGFEDWYDWSWEHWGTKWNSYYGHFVRNDTAYLYCTAWNPPFPVMRKLAELLNTPVLLEYFEHDYGEGSALIQPDGTTDHQPGNWPLRNE